MNREREREILQQAEGLIICVYIWQKRKVDSNGVLDPSRMKHEHSMTVGSCRFFILDALEIKRVEQYNVHCEMPCNVIRHSNDCMTPCVCGTYCGEREREGLGFRL